jgi:type IV pilus assembly protein PilC
MQYAYVAYNKERKLIKGKVAAADEFSAANVLSSGGFQVLSLKTQTLFPALDKLNISLTPVKIKDVIMFSRQLALLVSSGTDIVSAFELLESQTSDTAFRKAIKQVTQDVRSGSSLSAAMSRHPKVFPVVFWRAIGAGEKSGGLEEVLRQMADYMEKRMLVEKQIKGAFAYPVMVMIVAVIVVAVLVVFVLPAFAELYSSFGSDLPTITQIMINGVDFLTKYGIFMIGGFLATVAGIFLYSRSSRGKLHVDTVALRLPVLGRIINLNELSRVCRTMTLLYKVGLPLPEIMTLLVQGTGNKVLEQALVSIRRDLIRGEGLSKPMAKHKIFLPLMVAMVAVGEETGNLDTMLSTVAESYEVEAADKTQSAIGMIQPIMTVVMGGAVGFLAISMVSAMYSMYGEMGV